MPVVTSVATGFFVYGAFFSIFAAMKKVLKILFLAAMLFLPAMAGAQGYVKMNALYAPVGVMNPSIEFAVSKHSSVAFDATFSPWRSWNGKRSLFGIVLGEYRYYFKQATEGWYLSANGGMTFFNIHRVELFTNGHLISRQNDYGKGFSVAVGVGGGWAKHLGERWIMDIFLSVDKLWSWYNRYDGSGNINMHPNGHEGYLKPDPFNGSVETLPLKFGISFGYRILRPKSE